MPEPDLYAGYFGDDAAWRPIAPEWTDIKQCPRDRVYRMMEAGNTDVILGLWGTHAGDGRECWISAVDPYLQLRPRWFRDMVRPPVSVAP